MKHTDRNEDMWPHVPYLQYAVAAPPAEHAVCHAEPGGVQPVCAHTCCGIKRHACDAGQCNDAFFRMSRKKAVTFILDTPVALDETGVLCKSGNHLPADMIVNASGCRFDARPAFLQKLRLGETQDEVLCEPGTPKL